MTEFTKDMNIIAQLDDSPALSASELKAKFDEGGKAIKDYLNQTVKEAVEGIDEDVADLQGDMASAQGDITGMQSDISAAQLDITLLSSAVSGKQNTILSGTTEPAASLGTNGDIYIRY